MPLTHEIQGTVLRVYEFLAQNTHVVPPCLQRVEVTVYRLVRPVFDPTTKQLTSYAMDLNGVIIYCSYIPTPDQIKQVWATDALPLLNTRPM